VRLREGSLLEFVVRFVGTGPIIELAEIPEIPPVSRVGGRLLGRYWYNTDFGGR
jgi:hypothetical protein